MANTFHTRTIISPVASLDSCFALMWAKNPALSGHLRHDYLIKYAYCDKICYLERFASINDPENWTTNVA